ncbi:MAG: hypothetical protein FRX48_00413 [Lasallia pustulata]|uniref:Uncharacterized protein n=1 Tax=Lasallia pustulata TaxID=136370 RepID=A0A5M8Q3A6_9LECA|nr:MAG: hypothetical protein FRX48_00413 [Lasallia pustulata]
MRALPPLSLSLALLSSLALSSPPLCSNDAAHPAGTLFAGRWLPRAQGPVVWCAPDTRTYLIVTLVARLPGPLMLQLLSDAYSRVVVEMAEAGDGLLPGGRFEYAGQGGVGFYAVNTNNHQATWGVLGEAIEGLTHWMVSSGSYGAARFIVFDGENEVAQGEMGLG